MPYQWDEGFIVQDGNAWRMGINLAKCEKEPTGETVTLSVREEWSDREIPVECAVYRVSSALRENTEDSPIKWLCIAIGKAELTGWEGTLSNEYTVVFTDKSSFGEYLESMKR